MSFITGGISSGWMSGCKDVMWLVCWEVTGLFATECCWQLEPRYL
jgi:hypothetical protein